MFEFWFDGANGGDGYYGGAREKRTIDAPKYYNWPETIALVHKHQPMACTFDPLGADVRWVGNEDGVAGDPCWPTMPNAPYTQEHGNAGVRGAELWWPAETDVSIRPGWFYHADEDAKAMSPARLVKLLDESVGRGANLNLNLPPDRRGRIADHDVAVLTSFGDAMRATFATDLAHGAVPSATHSRGAGFGPERVLDGDRESYWAVPEGVTTPMLTLDLPPGRMFDLIRLSEYLPLGCRVTRFAVDAEVDGAWRTLATHECIAARRVIRLPAPVAARRVRLRVLEAPVGPAISEFALFRSVAPRPVATLVASDPTMLSPVGWRIVAASAPGAGALLDNDSGTSWIVTAPAPGHPTTVTIDIGTMHMLTGFSLTPSRQVMTGAAPPKNYAVETSVDNTTWRRAGAGEFPNIAYALQTQRIAFDAPVGARYLRFAFTETAVPAERLAIAGIGATIARPR